MHGLIMWHGSVDECFAVCQKGDPAFVLTAHHPRGSRSAGQGEGQRIRR